MIKAGVIGTGSMGSVHIDMINSNKKLKLVGLCKREKSRIEELKRKFKVDVFLDIDEFLNKKDMDYVVIAATPDAHEELTIKALSKGKNVIVEKPMSINFKSTERMIEASKKYKRNLFVHHNRRWDKDYLIIQDYLKSGILGEILSVQSRISDPGWPASGNEGLTNPWRAKPGAGMLLDWGSHLIDQILQMFGNTPSSIYGFIKKSGLKGDNKEYYFAIIKYNEHLICQVEVENMSIVPLPRWVVVGSRGILEVEGKAPVWDEIKVRIIKDNTFETRNLKIENAVEFSKGFYDNLISYVEGENKEFISMYEASNVIKIIDIIKKSSETNEIITLQN